MPGGYALALQPCQLHCQSRSHTARGFARVVVCRAQKPDMNELRDEIKQDKAKSDQGPVLKAVWSASEQFGNLVGFSKGKKQQATAKTANLPKMSRTEAIDEIKNDYQRNYFISGAGEMKAYEDNCLFADPFSAFRGVARFKKNVTNFSGLLEGVDLKIRKFEEQPEYVRAHWVFSSSIKLPWKPRIAAGGYTTHVFNKETGRVTYHKEEWQTEPSKVIKQLFSGGKQAPEP